MSATDARRPRVRAGLLGLALLATAPVQAQQTPRDSVVAAPAGRSWLDRLSIAAQYGVLRPAGGSELYALVDRALTPGADALRPKLAGGELHVRVRGPWSVVLGAETGSSTVGSVSRVQPAATAGGGAPRQRTTLDLTSVQHLGASWQALRWRGGSPDASDRLRLVLGAGGGMARYRLRQWGTFVDAGRALAFENDFRSTGRGGFGYASASAEVPLRRWVALQGVLRQQAGSAPMSADYASFDRLDLGGTRLSVGVLLHPASVVRALR
jgi:hypothetical protein